MPTISVIIPVYKAEDCIERCARSLFEQSFEEIEYVFVDDCSPDRSVSVLERIAEQYPKRKNSVKVLKNEKNLGVLKTRLKGIAAASGDYLIHCDADDWVEQDMYKKLYCEAVSKNADIVWCDFYKSDGNTHVPCTQSDSENPVRDLLLGKRQGSLWNHLVKKELVDDSRIVHPVQNMAEDMTLLLQYFLLAQSYAYVNELLYYYYQNCNSVSSGDSNEKIVSQAYQMSENVGIFQTFLLQTGIGSEWKNEVVFRKFFNKRWLLPAVDSVKNCRLWLDCHRDINFSLYRNPYITKKEKLISLLVELRLYPLLRKIIRGR